MIVTNRISRWTVIGAALALAACAQRPVFYPEASATGDPQAATDLCIQQAKQQGLDYHDGGEIARDTAEGGVIGGAGGAASGAVFGDAGRGAAAGAAYGATEGLLSGLFSGDAPDPVYRRYINHCLRERGYQPIGWR